MMVRPISILGLALACTVEGVRNSPGCGNELPNNVHAGHTYNYEIQVDDPMGEVTRTFRLHVPVNYNLENTDAVSLVLDYHGWGGSGHFQEMDSKLKDVSDEDPVGFLVVYPDGMNDQEQFSMGSFNCSRTDGPLGPPCDTDRSKYDPIPCYASCPNCNTENSCDWTSCHDDIAFTRTMMEVVSAEFCVNMDSVHMTGISNGGMFSYFAVSQLSDSLASIVPVAGSALLGFGDMPPNPVHLLDFHGFNDDTIPYDLDHSEGLGPYDTVISWDGFYYYSKPIVISSWVEGQGCDANPVQWATDMDGVDNWSCQLYSGCNGGKDVVSCTGDHMHDYPFGGDRYIEGARIMWKFMQSHTK